MNPKHIHSWQRISKETNAGRFRCASLDCGVLGFAPVNNYHHGRLKVRECKCAFKMPNGRNCSKPATIASFGAGVTQRYFCSLPGHAPKIAGAA